MFTQCPDCRMTYPVSKKQLRNKKTQIYCSGCNKKFKPLTLLDEKPGTLLVEAKTQYIPKPESIQKPKTTTPTENQPYLANVSSFLRKNDSNPATDQPVAAKPASERLPWEAEKKPFNINWLVASLIGLAFLLSQIIFLATGELQQNATYRPHLEKLCHLFGCKLADYENLAEFSVLQSSFTPVANGMMGFKAVINNQSAFKQRLPNIKLSLLDFDEQIFAQRIFTPKEYLSGKHPINSIPPDETITASLTMTAPKTNIGGYHFDLIY
jgi:predicted Zn finger-like uncharacterized protein